MVEVGEDRGVEVGVVLLQPKLVRMMELAILYLKRVWRLKVKANKTTR